MTSQEKVSAVKVDCPEFIFIVGNSRSGTTMLGRILGRHPDVHTLPEIHFFEELWAPENNQQHWTIETATQLAARLSSVVHDGYFTQGDADRYADRANQVTARSESLQGPVATFGAFLREEAVAAGKKIPCDQTPRNIFYLDEILREFPGAKVISMVRDPRDVLASQKSKWKRRFLGARQIPLKEALRAWANYHPLTMTRLWMGAVRTALTYDKHPRVLNLRFESLLQSPEKTLEQLGAFLGLEVSEDMLAVPQVGSSVKEDRPECRGIDNANKGGWRYRLDPAAIRLCQYLARREMEAFGYQGVDVRVSPLSFLWLGLAFPLKTGLALLLNLSRVRNLKGTIRRRLIRHHNPAMVGKEDV